MDFNIDIQAQRKLLESELEIDGDKYEYVELKNDQKKLFDNNFFDDENLTIYLSCTIFPGGKLALFPNTL